MSDVTFKSLTLPGLPTARVPQAAEEFDSATAYKVGDYCTFQGQLYKCKTNHQGIWNGNSFDLTDIAKEIKLNLPTISSTAPSPTVVGQLWLDTSKDGEVYYIDPYPKANSTNAVQSQGVKNALDIMDKAKISKINLAGDFSTSATYLVGDYTLYNGQFYKCIKKHSPGAWNSSHFKATSVGTEINSREELISKGVSDWLNEHPDSIVGVTEGSITAPLLATNSVKTEKVQDNAITNPKLAPGAVGTENLKSDLVVPIKNGGLGSTDAAGALTNLGAQKAIQKATGTLLLTGWSSNNTQNLSIDRFTLNSEFIASPSDAASWAAAADATLYPPTAANGALIFKCEDTPNANINITVYWW